MQMNEFDIAALTRFGDAPCFVFCDHASNAMPTELHCLGLPDDLLKTHIAWDIGAGALTTALAEKLQGTAFACGFSRLIVDVNRAPTAEDLIPAASDQIPIPGNQMLTEADRRARIEQYHAPYHDRLSAALDAMTEAHGEPFAISVHSFTNRLMGAAEDRPWRIGLLWSDDEESARAMIASLKRATDWTIGNNEPYDAREFNYSVDRHVSPRGLRHLTLEIRQDMLVEEDAVIEMAARLANGVRDVATRSAPRQAVSS